jgi:hypothetical protein
MGTNRKRYAVAGIVLLLAVSFMIYGIGRGEISIIWNKAINICLECIGLG